MHMDETANNNEVAADRAERRVAMRGLTKSSLWLPGNMLCNSRYWIDPELKRKYTSEVRFIKGEELKKYEAELLARDAKRR